MLVEENLPHPGVRIWVGERINWRTEPSGVVGIKGRFNFRGGSTPYAQKAVRTSMGTVHPSHAAACCNFCAVLFTSRSASRAEPLLIFTSNLRSEENWKFSGSL